MKNNTILPHMKQIPEWDTCYYDYTILEQILNLVNTSRKALAKLNKIKKQIKKQKKHGHQINNQRNSMKNQVSNLDVSQIMMTQSNIAGSSSLLPFQKINKKQNQLLDIKNNIQKIQDKWCMNFLTFSHQSSNSALIFVQMKMYQICAKYREYKILLDTVRSQKNNILVLIQNLYIETFYLQKAIKFNIYQQIRILQNFQQLSLKFNNKNEYILDKSNINRFKRVQVKIKKTIKQIQQNYLISNNDKYVQAYKNLHNLVSQNKLKTNSRSIIVGIIMGIMFFLILLIAGSQMYSRNTTDISIQNNNKFTNYFPSWRGASYMVFYLWMLTLDVIFYQKSQINYGLVFQLRTHNMPQSNYLLTYTSILSIIYFILFFIFILEIRGIIHGNFFFQGAVFWVVLLTNFLILNPLTQIKQKRSRFYLHKILLKVLLTPFIPMNMIIIWVTEQLSSFNQPFGDLFYTVCFFSSRNATFCQKNAPYASTAYILFIFLYRMIQNMKMWYQNAQKRPDKKLQFNDPPFIGFFRAVLSSITTVFALLQRLKLFQGTFGIWLTFVIITTLYSWFIDVKYDWGILNLQSKTLLREKLLFPNAKILYYFFALFNLVLRTAWVITISPIFFATKGFFSLIFIMVVSYLQILRRGIWNILRIQNQHIKNCGQFRATVNDSNILAEVKQAAKKQSKKQQQQSLEGKLMNQQNMRQITKNKEHNIQSQKRQTEEHLKQVKILFKQKLTLKQKTLKQLKQQLNTDLSTMNELKEQINKLNEIE